MCNVRSLRYIFASLLGSLLTFFVMSIREAALYRNWSPVDHYNLPAAVSLPVAVNPPPEVKPVSLVGDKICLISRPSRSSIRNMKWHVFSETGGQGHEISVFGAYFDDRQVTAKTLGTLRVFAVSSAPKTRLVFCQIWCLGQKGNPVVVPALISAPGRGYKNKKKVRYQEYLYTCPLGRNISRPVNVSLTFTTCQNSTILVPVVYSKKTIPTVNFGVCVAACYGELDPWRLIEWMETLTILGVGEVNVYVSSVTDRTLSVFRYYEERRRMVIRSAPPPISETSYWPRKLAVIPGFNDCIYRNMYRYNYTIIIDFDEIIVPHMHSNYSAMLAYMRKFHKKLNQQPDIFVFRNAYFFLDFSPTSNVTYKNFTTMTHTRRVDVSPRGYSVKSIFNPRACVIGWNHYCLARIPRTKALDVDPLYALSHHYKKCHFKKEECRKLMKRNVTDTAILKYKDSLRRRLSRVSIKL